ncbi:MAG: hypothetical protein ACRC62_08650, partial [Microcoleus sp.]
MIDYKSFLTNKNRHQKQPDIAPNSAVELASNWRIAWGKIDSIDPSPTVLHEDKIAIISSNPNANLSISPSKK